MVLLGQLRLILPAAMFFDGSFRLHDFEGHGEAASVLGDTGSAFSLSNWIHDSFANSLHHTIHACAHSRLDRCGVGVGSVVWELHVHLCCLCCVFLVLMMMWMLPVWMDLIR